MLTFPFLTSISSLFKSAWVHALDIEDSYGKTFVFSPLHSEDISEFFLCFSLLKRPNSLRTSLQKKPFRDINYAIPYPPSTLGRELRLRLFSLIDPFFYDFPRLVF
ncbi:hypothetical protein HCUR_00664 [Holospora curviuscula]|uniref:Uncharacterized protein n=1 Tax=Holospora curviuscula TaxID=1082868 RepID=A0A2S5R990_9PROT|nr:hypothetical protein HCUR_00664 [Holospora curviuscula]